MSVSGVIKSIQDIMRKDAGVDGDAQRIGQLGWMLFLKIFDDQDQELALLQDDYRSPLPERLRWSTWAADPEGYKSYSKTKPMRVEEFAPEKAWWDDRKENEHAWKVPVEDIVATGYNLDIKNPHDPGDDLGDPDELLAEYKALLAGVEETREALKNVLEEALTSTRATSDAGRKL